MSKSFKVAADRAVDGVEVVERLDFTIDGTEETLWAYVPSAGQLVLLTAAAGARDATRQSAEFMETFWSLVEPETGDILRARMLDARDPFGLPDVLNIIEWLAEESTGRPTRPSDDSSGSRTNSGDRSTEPVRARASTRSRSPQIAS